MRGEVFGLVLAVAAVGLLSSGASVPAAASGPVGASQAVVHAQPAFAPDTPAVAQVVPAAPPELLPQAAPLPAAAPAVVPAAAPKPKPKPKATLVKGTPCKSTASACVDLSANRAWLLNDGKITMGPVPITHGRKGFLTPPGTFRVSYKAKDHVSSIYDAEMPYSVFFNGGIAFHQGSVRVTSHGCVHLTGAAARTFFGGLRAGDVVQVVA